MRAKEIYDGLIERWGTVCNDEPWISSIKKDYNLREIEWNPDCFFLITLSWGPWVISRQMDVWHKMKNSFPEIVTDIRKADKSFNGFPFEWQNDRVRNVSKYLKEQSKNFQDIIAILQLRTGFHARDYLAGISGANQNKKTISCFVRDFLLKDTFPIDTRVTEMLSCLGLPNDEDKIIQLCQMEGISSRILDRMLYMQWDECPDKAPGPKNECGQCRIKDYCWEYIIK